jgi:ferredoxin-type protein NapH
MVDRTRLVRLILNRPHRYRQYRVVTMVITLGVLLAVPLSGLARVDLWGGGHRLLGRPVTLGVGVGALCAAVAVFYGATFLINMVAGRMFCGFGCPVGQLCRFADAADAHATAGARRRSWLNLVLFAVALSAATSVWFVTPAVLLSGNPAAIALTAAGIALAAALAVLHARRWRWSFCRKLCPIGLYYSIVQSTALIGVEFDDTARCTDCGACVAICPVGLDPRRMAEPIPSPGGLAFSDLPAGNHCLHCGACIEVCEQMMRKQPGPTALGFHRPRRHAPAGVV